MNGGKHQKQKILIWYGKLPSLRATLRHLKEKDKATIEESAAQSIYTSLSFTEGISDANEKYWKFNTEVVNIQYFAFPKCYAVLFNILENTQIIAKGRFYFTLICNFIVVAVRIRWLRHERRDRRKAQWNLFPLLLRSRWEDRSGLEWSRAESWSRSPLTFAEHRYRRPPLPKS